MENCLKCSAELENKRKKFCSSHCQYWYNLIKKEKESHLAPFRKRNRKFFSMVIGYTNSCSRSQQGKRSGGMVKGSMSAIVNVTVESWAEVTYENIKRHFTSIHFWQPSCIMLGDGTRIKKKHIERELNIKIDF